MFQNAPPQGRDQISLSVLLRNVCTQYPKNACGVNEDERWWGGLRTDLWGSTLQSSPKKYLGRVSIWAADEIVAVVTLVMSFEWQKLKEPFILFSVECFPNSMGFD